MEFNETDMLHLAVKINKIVQDRCLGVPDNIGRDLVKVVMGHQPGVNPNGPAMAVIEAISKHEKQHTHLVCGKSRERGIKECRDLCIYILHKHLVMTHERIAAYFSNRNPSTITTALKRTRMAIYDDNTLFLKVTRIEKELEANGLIHIKE